MSFLQRLWKGSSNVKKENNVPTIEDEEHNPYTELLLLQHHTDIVRQIVVIDHRKCLSVADDNVAVIWDLLLGLKLAILIGHTRPITCVLLISSKVTSSPDLIVTGSSDKQIKVWNYEGFCLQTITDHNSSVKCLLLLENGSFVSGGEKLHLWSSEGRLLDSYNREEEEADVSFMILVKNKRIVTASNKDILVFQIVVRQKDNSEIKEEITLFRALPQVMIREPVRCLVNISETLFAVGCLDGCILILSSETYQSILQFSSPDKYKGANSNYPYSIQDMICVDQRFLVAAVGSGFAIFDIKLRQILCKPHYSHFSKILHLSFVCNCSLLATSSEDGSIRLWGQIPDRESDAPFFEGVMERFFNKSFEAIEVDIKSRNLPNVELIGECLGHSGAVNMVVDGGGDVMVTCGVDGLVICWKNAEIQKIKRNQILQKKVLSGSGIV